MNATSPIIFITRIEIQQASWTPGVFDDLLLCFVSLDCFSSLLELFRDESRPNSFLEQLFRAFCERWHFFPQVHETSCGFQHTSEASFRKHDSIVLQVFDLTDLWSLLIAYHEDFWLRPTAVFLSSSIQLHVDLQTLGDQLLHRAYRDAKDAADWPKGCASMELAIRSDKQEQHHLLVRAYNMDPRNEVLRALAEQAPAQLMTAQHVGAKRRRLDGSQLAFSDRNADGLIKAQDRAVMSFVWNLSVYDFTRFRKGGQTSVKLPLSWGNAWMSLYPMGEDGSLPGKASLRLHFENAFYVRGKVRGGSQAGTNLSLDRPGTWLRRNFMDTSEILHQKDAWITLRIVSVQLPALQLGRVRS